MSGNVLLPGCRERAWEPGEDYERHASGLWLPGGEVPAPASVPESQPIGIDLFAGAGGFSLGFHQAGWHVIAASEAWHIAAITYLLNLGEPYTVVHVLDPIEGDKNLTRPCKALHDRYAGDAISAEEFFAWHRKKVPADMDRPGDGWISGQEGVQPCEHLYLGDVRALTGERILSDLDLTSDDIGCVFGGPPCQGFSRAGKQDRDDPRNELAFEFIRIVCEVHPRAFCMENVPGIVGMVTKEGLPVIDALALMAEEGGMGTFEAIRRSLAETAGVGVALRTQKMAGGRGKHPSVSADRFEDEDEDLEPDPQGSLFDEALS